VGTSFTVSFDGYSGGTSVDGLTGQVTYTLTAVTDTSYEFAYSVSNTGSVDSRISSFAFNVNPDISSATSTGAFSYTTLDKNYPNGIGTVDVCFKGGGSKSCGGNSGGVATADTGTGTLSLTFDGGAPSPITIDSFYVRYQSITGVNGITSASGTGTLTSTGGTINPPSGGSTSTGGSTSSGGTEVPEPGVLGLLGVALVGLGFARSRRRTRTRPALAA
jgi:hypothetical protein